MFRESEEESSDGDDGICVLVKSRRSLVDEIVFIH